MSDYIPKEIWLADAKRLPLGGRMMAPACCRGDGSRNSLLITHKPEGYSAYCFRCSSKGWESKGDRSIGQLAQERADREFSAALGASLPDDFTTDLDGRSRIWLASGGVCPDRARLYGIGYSKALGRCVLPVYDGAGALLFVQARDLTGFSSAKYISQANVPKEEILAWSKETPEISDVLVLTEDFLSAIVVGAVAQAAALMGTSMSAAQMGKILRYKRVTVWLDGDSAGREASLKIVRTLRLGGVDVRRIVTDADPKKLSKATIRRLINEAWT